MEDAIIYKTRMYDFRKFFISTVIGTIIFAIVLIMQYRNLSIPINQEPYNYMAASSVLFIFVCFTILSWVVTSWNTPTLIFTGQYFARQEGKKLCTLITLSGTIEKIAMDRLKGVRKSGFAVTLSFLDDKNREQRITFFPPDPEGVYNNIDKIIRQA